MEMMVQGKKLDQYLQAAIQEVAPEGKVSYLVSLVDDDGWRCVTAYQERSIHAGASMVKVLIMAYLFHLAETEQLDMMDSLSLEKVPRVEGGGALQELLNHRSFTYLELCRLMIVLSDNWATNLLIRSLGMEYINYFGESIGLEHFRIARMMMDAQASSQGVENEITALDYMRLLFYIFQKKEESLYGHEMWTILGRQQFRDVLPFHWGEDVVFHHKTGSLDAVIHDGGIVLLQRGYVGMVALMSHIPNDIATALGAQLGRIMKDYVEEILP